MSDCELTAENTEMYLEYSKQLEFFNSLKKIYKKTDCKLDDELCVLIREYYKAESGKKLKERYLAYRNGKVDPRKIVKEYYFVPDTLELKCERVLSDEGLLLFEKKYLESHCGSEISSTQFEISKKCKIVVAENKKDLERLIRSMYKESQLSLDM